MCTQAGSFLQVDRVHTDSPYPTSPYLWSSRETNLRSWVWPTVSNRLSRQCQLALDWPSASSRWLCSDGQWILYRQSLPPDGCVQMDSGFFIDSHCLPFRWTVDSPSTVTAMIRELLLQTFVAVNPTFAAANPYCGYKHELCNNFTLSPHNLSSAVWLMVQYQKY